MGHAGGWTLHLHDPRGSAQADSSSPLFAKHVRKTVRHLCACCCGQLAKALYHASLVYGSYLIEHYLSLLALK